MATYGLELREKARRYNTIILQVDEHKQTVMNRINAEPHLVNQREQIEQRLNRVYDAIIRGQFQEFASRGKYRMSLENNPYDFAYNSLLLDIVRIFGIFQDIRLHTEIENGEECRRCSLYAVWD